MPFDPAATAADQPDKPGSPWPFLIGLGCVAIVLAGGLIAFRPKPKKAPVRPALAQSVMPDGTTLRVEKVTFGHLHLWSSPEVAGSDRNFKPNSPLLQTGEDKVVVWLTRHDSAGRPLDFDWWSHNTAVIDGQEQILDEHAGRNVIGGLQSTVSGSRPFSPADGAGRARQIVAHSDFPAFRSQSRTFELRVFDVYQRRVATFNVPVPPNMGPYPVWQAASLPNVQQDGKVAATLVQVKCTRIEIQEDGAVRQILRLAPELSIEEDGRVNQGWENPEWELADALRNQGDLHDCRLSRREAAWKFKVRLLKDKTAAFPPEAVFQAPEFSLPKVDAWARWSGSALIGVVNVQLQAVGGSGFWSYTGPAVKGPIKISGGDNGCSYTVSKDPAAGGGSFIGVEANWPHVRVQARGTDLDTRLIARIQDDQGNDLEDTHAQIDDEHFWFFNPLPDSKTVRVTFIVQRAKKFEFMIDPATLSVPVTR